MKQVHHWLSGSAALLLAAVLLLSGCSEGDSGALVPAADQNPPGFDPDDPFGGFTMTDEEPAFGDPDLLAGAAEEADAGDGMRNHPEIGAMDEDPDVRIYALAIVWGNLPGQEVRHGERCEADGTDYDWSGSVSVTTGAMVLKNTISFERRQGDRVVFPRTDRQTIEWVSHTGCGHDGLRLLVYQRPADEAGGILRFETALYSSEVPISSLAEMDEVIDVDAEGNQVRFLGSAVLPHEQTGRGFMRGRWGVMAPGDSVGHFQGIWVCARGRVEGYMRGYYGHNDAGRRVFFGKYIDERGGFRGILRGTWNPAPQEGRPLEGRRGTFEGRWLDDGGRHDGDVAGRWHHREGGPGCFDGRWWTAPPPPPKD